MNEPGHCRQLIFWRLSSHAAFHHDDSRAKLEPKHRPSDRRACLFVGRFRKQAGVIGYTHMDPVRRNLAMEAVQWRWSSCRFYSAGHRCDDPALPKLRGLPSEISRPITCALRTTSRSTTQQAALAPEPCRSIPGNRSSKLGCGTRDAWRGSSRPGTSTNVARAASRPVAPNMFRVSASQRENILPVAPARIRTGSSPPSTTRFPPCPSQSVPCWRRDSRPPVPRPHQSAVGILLIPGSCVLGGSTKAMSFIWLPR
jgi:hypothetical protein